MKKIFTLIAFVCMASTADAQIGGRQFEKYWTGYGWAYRQCATCAPAQSYVAPVQAYVAPVQQEKTTIVNNLIGIPVPVQYSQPIAAQGNTVYGYASAAEAYGNVDMGLLYNQAARLTDQAQQLAGQAASDFQTLVQSEGQNRAEVAKILAQGQAAREALSAAKGVDVSQQQQFRSFTFKVTQDATGMKIEPLQQAPTPDLNLGHVPQNLKGVNISDVLRNRCVSCHGSEKQSGGLNFETPITELQQANVLERITSKDATKRMPPQAKGDLSISELNAFFQAMGQPAQK